MIRPSVKMCDNCNEVVAIKHCIRYVTKKKYITIRGDDITTYVNREDNTTPFKLHYCKTCWNGFWGAFNAK